MDGIGGKDKALLMTEKCQGENNVKYIYCIFGRIKSCQGLNKDGTSLLRTEIFQG